MAELKFEGKTFGQIVDILIKDNRARAIKIYTTLDCYMIEYDIDGRRFYSYREINND